MTVQYIDTPPALNAFCEQIRDSRWLAVDTEFIREKTYYPQLSLLQLANDEVIACIDPLAITDLTPLFDILYSPSVTLVFHAARQDLELFLNLRGSLPQQIFDTQLAATILGLGEQVGYGALISHYCQVELDKTHSRTDWMQRPLSQAQLDYAADDVRYLRTLYHEMSQTIDQQQRRAWLDSDFAALSNPETYYPNPDNIWRKLRGAGKLKRRQLAVLQQLAIWREQTAEQRDRPRRWILKDDVMLDLARFTPDSITKLTQIRGLEARDIERYGKTIIAVIEKSLNIPEADWPILKKPTPLTAQQEALIDASMALLRKFCDEQSITPIAVASRKDIEKLVRGEPELALLTGWRRDLIGQKLHDFLNGQLAITASTEQLYINEVTPT